MAKGLQFDVTSQPGVARQRILQQAEDDAARALLFQGAQGRVTASTNAAEAARRAASVRERGASMDAAKLYTQVAGMDQGPVSSGAALGAAAEIGAKADVIRGTALGQAAESIYAAESDVAQRQMEQAEVLKGASVFAEREAKMGNFIQTVNGIRADLDNGVIDGDQAWQQINALLQLESDPVLREQMRAAAWGSQNKAKASGFYENATYQPGDQLEGDDY
jgi:hypothetical protein